MQFQLFIFYEPACLHKYFHQRALWADSVSLQMNAIASRLPFKPIRIGKKICSDL